MDWIYIPASNFYDGIQSAGHSRLGLSLLVRFDAWHAARIATLQPLHRAMRRDATSVAILQSDIYRSRVYFYSANIHKSTGRIKGLLIPLAFCCRRRGGEPLKANVAVKWLDVIFPLFSWSEETTFLPIPRAFSC